MARGNVVVQSQDANGNIIGSAHENTLLIPDCIRLSPQVVRFQS